MLVEDKTEEKLVVKRDLMRLGFMRVSVVNEKKEVKLKFRVIECHLWMR